MIFFHVSSLLKKIHDENKDFVHFLLIELKNRAAKTTKNCALTKSKQTVNKFQKSIHTHGRRLFLSLFYKHFNFKFLGILIIQCHTILVVK